MCATLMISFKFIPRVGEPIKDSRLTAGAYRAEHEYEVLSVQPCCDALQT